jgi:hypothetical protein
LRTPPDARTELGSLLYSERAEDITASRTDARTTLTPDEQLMDRSAGAEAEVEAAGGRELAKPG